MSVPEIVLLSIFFAAVFVLFIFAVIDLFKIWRMRERDEKRREKFINNISLLSAYFYAKGTTEGFNLDFEDK